MEAKGLGVNAGKTKVVQCRVSRVQSEDSGKHFCGVYRKGVGDNSIRCVECLRWVHKRCSGISGKLKSNVDFHCRRCLEGEHGLFQSVLGKEVVIEPNVKLECVPKFCYLGDTLGAGGGVDEVQGSYESWKVMEIFRSWKSHGKVMEFKWSWKSHGILKNQYFTHFL